eukprot:41469-Chlamydomonas_euryale.AAC.2
MAPLPLQEGVPCVRCAFPSGMKRRVGGSGGAEVRGRWMSGGVGQVDWQRCGAGGRAEVRGRWTSRGLTAGTRCRRRQSRQIKASEQGRHTCRHEVSPASKGKSEQAGRQARVDTGASGCVSIRAPLAACRYGRLWLRVDTGASGCMSIQAPLAACRCGRLWLHVDTGASGSVSVRAPLAPYPHGCI